MGIFLIKCNIMQLLTYKHIVMRYYTCSCIYIPHNFINSFMILDVLIYMNISLSYILNMYSNLSGRTFNGFCIVKILLSVYTIKSIFKINKCTKSDRCCINSILQDESELFPFHCHDLPLTPKKRLTVVVPETKKATDRDKTVDAFCHIW